MRSALDLNDARINRISVHEGIGRVEFSHAYVYKSRDRPGVDVGTEWSQPVDLVIGHAELRGEIPPLPATVLEGWLELGDVRLDLLPLPFRRRGAARVFLRFADGSKVELAGRAPEIELIGEAKFLE